MYLNHSPDTKAVLGKHKDNGTQEMKFPTMLVAASETDSNSTLQGKLKELQKDSKDDDIQKGTSGSVLTETGKSEKSSLVAKKDSANQGDKEAESHPAIVRSTIAQRRRSGLDFVPRRRPRRSSVVAEENLKKRLRLSSTKEPVFDNRMWTCLKRNREKFRRMKLKV